MPIDLELDDAAIFWSDCILEMFTSVRQKFVFFCFLFVIAHCIVQYSVVSQAYW
jgi:hypothetical protein